MTWGLRSGTAKICLCHAGSSCSLTVSMLFWESLKMDLFSSWLLFDKIYILQACMKAQGENVRNYFLLSLQQYCQISSIQWRWIQVCLCCSQAGKMSFLNFNSLPETVFPLLCIIHRPHQQQPSLELVSNSELFHGNCKSSKSHDQIYHVYLRATHRRTSSVMSQLPKTVNVLYC